MSFQEVQQSNSKRRGPKPVDIFAPDRDGLKALIEKGAVPVRLTHIQFLQLYVRGAGAEELLKHCDASRKSTLNRYVSDCAKDLSRNGYVDPKILLKELRYGPQYIPSTSDMRAMRCKKDGSFKRQQILMELIAGASKYSKVLNSAEHSALLAFMVTGDISAASQKLKLTEPEVHQSAERARIKLINWIHRYSGEAPETIQTELGQIYQRERRRPDDSVH